MKVRIKNFQSVEDAELEIEGFTVLVGKSNIGKSAIIRAIQGAVTNREGEDFVTHGADFSEVQIDCPEIQLEWKKGSGYNDYVINGDKLESVGRGAPPHIEEAGFGEMKVGRDSINVQISDQFHPLFLLNETGSLAAEAISDVGRLNEVQEALRDAESDRRGVRSTLKVREKDLVDVRDQLDEYDHYDDDMAQVDEVRAYHRDITDLNKELDYLQEVDRKKSTHEDQIQTLGPVAKLDVPEWDGDADLKEVESLERLERQFERGKAGLQKYAGVEKVDIPEWDGDALVGEIETLSRFSQRAEKLLRTLHECKGLDDLTLPDLEDLKASQEEVEYLADLDVRFKAAYGEIPTLKQEVKTLGVAIEEKKEELHDVLHEAGQCPTCERGVE